MDLSNLSIDSASLVLFNLVVGTNVKPLLRMFFCVCVKCFEERFVIYLSELMMSSDSLSNDLVNFCLYFICFDLIPFLITLFMFL